MIRKFIIVLVLLLTMVSTGGAERKLIEADGTYVVTGSPPESAEVAGERARANAKRAAAEQAGVFVESFSEMKDGTLTRDEIRTISSTVLYIQSEKITPVVLGATVEYHCHIRAMVDTDSVERFRLKDREQFNEAVRRNRELESEVERVNAELAALKARYQTASAVERQQLDLEIRRNEEQFTTAQLNRRGLDRYSWDDYDGAIELYRQAIEIDPNNAESWNGLGWAYHGRGEYAQAIEYFNRALAIDRNYASSWNGLGYASNYAGEYERAIDFCRRAIDLDPSYASPWNNLGYAFDRLGHHDRAIECYQKSIELDAKDARAWSNLGYSYNQKGEYDSAIKAGTKAVELNPKSSAAWNGLGNAYNHVGKFYKAVECCKKAIALDRSYADAYNNLGYAYGGLGRYKESAAAYKKAAELAPDVDIYKKNSETARKRL